MQARTSRLAAAAAGLILAAAMPAQAQDKIQLANQVQAVKFAGDLRLRFENFKRSGPGTNDRRRFRFRLREGADFQLPNGLLASVRLASGTGEQVSSNQTFDNLASQKQIWIDQAYLRWTPTLSPNGTAYVQGGKIVNSLWRPYSSDLIWDDDVSPEGFSQGMEWLLPGGHLSLFANALQMVADEDKATPRGQWEFSEQLGIETHLPLSSRLRLAGAYHRWSLETRDDFGQNATQEGNRRRTADPAKGALINQFGVGELTGQLSTWVGGLPLVFQGTYAQNLLARDDLSPKADRGYQGGVILGRAKAARSWEAAFFRKRAEMDVTVADVADSDFGDGGTNRKGSIFWVAYNPQEWSQIKVKFFNTQRVDNHAYDYAYHDTPKANSVNRLQLDYSVKF